MVDYNDFLTYFLEQIDLQSVQDKMVIFNKELDILESKNIKLDIEQFQVQMITFQSIVERCSSMFWDLKNVHRRYEELFSKLVFLRSQEPDIKSLKNTQPEKRHLAELDLLKYLEVLTKIESTIDRVAMFKDSYKQRHDTLSRVFSYLQYKMHLKEV